MSRKGIHFKEVTELVGDVYEDDKCIVCYIDNEKLKYMFRKHASYNIYLYEINNKIETVKVDKIVYYVFSEVVFDKGVNIETFNNVKVIFRNCIFNDFIKLLGVDDVTFKNNKYFDNKGFYECAKTFLYGYGKKVRFINDSFVNVVENDNENNFGIFMDFEKMEIVNSKISVDTRPKVVDGCKDGFVNNGEIYIRVKNLVVKNSFINCPSIYLEYDSADCFSSKFRAKSGMIIDSKENGIGIDKIDSPYIVYNGDVVKEGICNELMDGRKNFVNQLRLIRDYLNYINECEIKKMENEIRGRSWSKVLKI